MRISATPPIQTNRTYQTRQNINGIYRQPQRDSVSFGMGFEDERTLNTTGDYKNTQYVGFKELTATRDIDINNANIDGLLKASWGITSTGELNATTVEAGMSVTLKDANIDGLLKAGADITSTGTLKANMVTSTSGSIVLNNADIARMIIACDDITSTGTLKANMVKSTSGSIRLNNADIEKMIKAGADITSTGTLKANMVTSTSGSIVLNNADIARMITACDDITSTGTLKAKNVKAGTRVSLKDAHIESLEAGGDIRSTGHVSAGTISGRHVSLHGVSAKWIISKGDVSLGQIAKLGNIAILDSGTNQYNQSRTLTFNSTPALRIKKIAVYLGDIKKLIIETPDGTIDILKNLELFDAKTTNKILKLFQFFNAEALGVAVVKKASRALTQAKIQKFIEDGIIKIVKIAV